MSDETGIDVHVLVVSASPGRSDDTTGPAVSSALESCGHTVADHTVVGTDRNQIQGAVRAMASAGAQGILVIGGTTPFEGSVSIEALRPLICPAFPGFEQIFRRLWYDRAGSQAVWADVIGGLVGRTAVFALPPSVEAADLAIRQLIGPQLSAAAGLGMMLGNEVTTPAAPAEMTFDLGPDPVTQEAVFEEVEAEVVDDEPAPTKPVDELPPLPAPSGGLGALGRKSLQIGLEGQPDAAPPPPEEAETIGRTGWLRALREIEGTLHLDKREELPQPVEKLAPFVEILHNAGETGVMKLPSGVTYSVWGFPDLRRPGSKVLAVGWGRPVVELLALHRYPVLTGTCLDDPHGLLPGAAESVEDTAEAITGSKPSDLTGTVFAVEADAVWIHRAGKVSRFDGRKDTDMGSPKQALVTLALAWSSR